MAASHPRLRWHADRQAYELEEEDRSVSSPFPLDDDGWFAWLEGVSSFSFQGQHGQLTVRKEARPRGAQYWYAYRRIGPKMAKRRSHPRSLRGHRRYLPYRTTICR